MSKIKRDKDSYEYDSDDFRSEDLEGVKPLTRKQLDAGGFPRPEEFAKMLRTENIDLTVSSRTLDFFKTAAKKERIPYQRLICTVLEFYADNADRLPKISPA